MKKALRRVILGLRGICGGGGCGSSSVVISNGCSGGGC